MTLGNISTILFYFATLTCLARAIVRTTSGLHILQLDGYKTGRYLKWIRQHLKSCFEVKEILVIGGLLVLTAFYPQYHDTWFFPMLCVAWGGFQVYLSTRQKKVEVKKPLVYTARAKRVFGLSICLLVSLATTLVLIAQTSPWRIAIFLFSEISVINLTIANLLIYPLERTINGAYLFSARKRIRTLQPRVIGITGSYGKTSTKYILHQILSQKFNTLMTPDSYNTPMGICKVIRGELTAEHEIFIVEMGAYKRGDIRELCNLAAPEIGILTAVGPQHLERFKSIENIAKGKYELIESLPADGLAVFNCDNEICAGLADKREQTGNPVRRYATEASLVVSVADTADLIATNVRYTDNGLAFTVHANTEKFDITDTEIQTRLLGKHNVSNILAAVTVAMECGMELEEIREAVANVEPVPHRLQLTAGAGGVTIIDDSFNSNPVGAKAALEVLTEIGERKKVLVTPGMVELGEREYEENRRLGEQAADVCDLVILVGPTRTTPILEGLKAAEYPSQQIIVTLNLEEVKQHLATQVQAGDVVLFENDLPDNYKE
ncbi:UDP-N-acetylmuramoyl-tripeptide--D-alanyl-D-alanine ligase [Candidatus Poribacteria bacterium]|nr:UDP-N-acetylmuramoyl-tripeptide--D-alanyl-D-alanine ligase [Candidatus Poribacteria bacterium]MYG09141.1 UDP-N-acetylmuramoyl-tripeptide--D-alanyl-D-alanine ligase [Candidatus Poribacteria bacterium]MYK21750.1 UDP-N-acetylmuramoyl-tripeptide--D-alanyl-D-alanine ligase [Candidatus Poribacteria bacterium]